MTSKAEVAEIAGKLTKAQRGMLLALPINRHAADKRTAKALLDRELLVCAGSVPNPGMPAWPYPAFSISPLGLAIRQHIIGEGA